MSARLSPNDCVAVIAGGGTLPIEIADLLKRDQQRTLVIVAKGEADEKDFPGIDRIALQLEEFSGLISVLKRHAVTHVVMAGTIQRRPKFTALKLNFHVVRSALSAATALARGDNALLRFLINYLEGAGFSVIGVQDLLPQLVVGEGVLTDTRPSRRDELNIDAAVQAAKAIGDLDIGQAAVSIGGRVIALEGIEGTDGLLERTVELRRHGRLARAKGGVLAKCAKPGQELRADLPTIGPHTVMAAVKAGLSGIAVEANRTLLLEREKTLELANARKVFIVSRVLESER